MLAGDAPTIRLWERRLQTAVWGDDGERAGAAEVARRRLTLRAVAAAALAAGLLATLHAFATPPFAPPDETSHVAYALAITEGHRPFVFEFPEPSRIPLMREGLSVWTANHPPLHHLVAGVPLRLGELTGLGLAGFYAARLVSVAAYAVGVVLVAWLVVLLAPGRPALAVSAAGVAGSVPHLLHVAGTAYNDATAFLLATATAVAAVTLLLRGPTRLRVGLLAAAAAAAAATRISGLFPLALAGAAAVAAPLMHGGGGLAPRLRRGLVHGAAVGVTAAAAAGTFYVQNLVRYGGLTATGTLMELFGRQPRGGFPERLAWRGFWRDVHTQLWSRVNESSHLPDALLIPFRWWAALLGAGLLAAALHRLATGTWRPTLASAAAWAIPGALLAGTVVTFALFVSRGGSAHARYLLPALAVIAALAATGAARLPGGRRGLPAAALTLSLLVAAVVTLRGFALHTDIHGAVLAVKRLALDGGAGFAVLTVVTLALLGAAYAVQASALWRLAPQGVPARSGSRSRGERAGALATWRRDPAATLLAALSCALAGSWAVAWYVEGLPGVAGAVAGLAAGPFALLAAGRR